MTQLSLAPPTVVRQRLRAPARAAEAAGYACLEGCGRWADVVLPGADGVGVPWCRACAEKRR